MFQKHGDNQNGSELNFTGFTSLIRELLYNSQPNPNKQVLIIFIETLWILGEKINSVNESKFNRYLQIASVNTHSSRRNY